MRRAGATLAALTALAVSACAHHAPLALTSASPGSPLAPLPGRICTACGCRTATDLHRQYCDVRRRRYYYFDLDKKQYFWESGQSK